MQHIYYTLKIGDEDLFRRLLPYYGKYKKTILFAPIFVIIETICELILPTIGGKIIDNGIANGDRNYILSRGILMIVIAVVAVIFGVLSARAGTYSNQGFAYNLRNALFEKVQEFSFADIDRFSSGSLITRITTDINIIVQMLAMLVRMLPRSLVQFFGALIMILAIRPQLALVMLVVLPVLFLCAAFVMKTANKLFTAMQRKVDDLNSTVQENLIGIRVVKAFVRRDFEKEKFERANLALTDASLSAMNRIIIIQPLLTLCMMGAIGGVLWTGGGMILSGVIKEGDLTAAIQYITQILMSVMMIAMTVLNYSRAKACAIRAQEVLDAVPDIQDQPQAAQRALPDAKGAVRFADVSFHYANTADVLEHINLDVAPGEFVAVVGGTGAGKSSLVNLIARFYDTTGGTVTLDGLNVREYPLHTLRERVGMVLQKNVLFSGTIRENLRWGKEDATDEELAAATKSADIYDFIMGLPDGFDSWVEQGGTNFSGGQKQRLCIARAMIKSPAVLILDDSTSAVDTATEARIRTAFKRDLPGTTVIIIAQRISSVQYADKIVVLDEGKISGIGNHEQLMAENRIYQEIYSSQQEGVQAS